MVTEPLLSPGVVVLTDSRPARPVDGFDQHHGVGPVACGDPHLGTGDFHDGRYGPWGGECRHEISPLVSYVTCLWLLNRCPGGQARFLKVESDHRYPTRAIPAHQATAAIVSLAFGAPVSSPRNVSMIGVNG